MIVTIAIPGLTIINPFNNCYYSGGGLQLIVLLVIMIDGLLTLGVNSWFMFLLVKITNNW